MTEAETHIAAIEFRLSNERNRLALAKTAAEKEMRAVWVAQIEKELTHAVGFSRPAEPEMTDEELLKALTE